MAANFPVSKDDVSTVGDDTHPSADEALSSTVGGPAHHALHQNTGEAIRAIEDKVGTGASEPAANTVLTSIDSGTSVWGTVATAMIATDAIDGTKIADDAINSEHYVDGSIDRVHLAADIIDGTKLADNAVNSEHYVDGSIDRVHLAADIVDGTKIADNSIDSEHYVDGSIDTAHLADDAVTADKIADNAVGNDQLIASPTFTTVTATNMTLGGQDLGEIVSFTPTWDNVSGTWQSNTGYYAYVKDLVYISVEAELSASTSVNSTIRLNLPVTGSDTHQSANGMMQVQLFDFNENKYYQGMTVPSSTSKVEVRYNIVVNNEIFGQPAVTDGPFTWADGDKILISGIYRVGS